MRCRTDRRADRRPRILDYPERPGIFESWWDAVITLVPLTLLGGLVVWAIVVAIRAVLR